MIFAPQTPELQDQSYHFLYDVSRSSQMKFLKSELRYSTPLWNAKATNEGESADFAHFDTKIGCHGNVPWEKKWLDQ